MSVIETFTVMSLGISMPLVYADGGDTSLVHACVKANGTVRITSANASCDAHETAVHWRITGPQGPQVLRDHKV